MKKIFKRIFYHSPEITISLGLTAIFLAASPSANGGVAPDWTVWGAYAGLAVFCIGVFLGRVREEVKEKENFR